MSGWTEVLRSTDLVRLSWAEATLKAAGVETIVYDAGVSAVEAGVSAFPRRLMARADDAALAVRLLAAADPEAAD
ncbi:MAG: DUF2007 domain-containing protein [Pseudomonadota bacterium]